MDFKISKILSGGEHQNLCRFIKRIKKEPCSASTKILFNFLKKRLSSLRQKSSGRGKDSAGRAPLRMKDTII